MQVREQADNNAGEKCILITIQAELKATTKTAEMQAHIDAGNDAGDNIVAYALLRCKSGCKQTMMQAKNAF